MTGCLRDLTVLDVFEFDRLTYLLTLDMFRSLGNLRKIRVKGCKNMVGIIQPAKEANSRVISHSSLVELVLFDLESLQCVHDGQVLHCANLTRIGVWKCGLLDLPELLGVRGNNIIEIEGEKKWWDAFQQRNLGIFNGCPVRFKEAPIPPEVSSSPRINERFAIDKSSCTDLQGNKSGWQQSSTGVASKPCVKALALLAVLLYQSCFGILKKLLDEEKEQKQQDIPRGVQKMESKFIVVFPSTLSFLFQHEFFCARGMPIRALQQVSC
ncbi:hypothetical protein Ancab_004740 [Ancistrocladus abbreviatus]